MSLPNAWVERIFSKMLVRYGANWMRMWEGIDIEAVKADWASELAGFAQQPAALAYGLEHLPDRPPTAHQFRDACRRAPTSALLAITESANPDDVAKETAKLAATAKRIAGPVDREWARRVKARMDAGFKTSIAVREMVADTLRGQS